jgi:periplasmic protein TonB
MFDQTFVDAQAQTRRPWTVAISLALQTTLIAIALIAPLLHIASLEAPPKIPLWLPLEKLNLKMKPETKATPRQSLATQRPVFRVNEFRAPTSVPRNIDLSPDAPSLADLSTVAGAANSSPGALLPEIIVQPPPAPVVKSNPSPRTPILIGGAVQAAKLVSGPKPAYPPLARATRTQGTVRIQAVIARDGSIGNLQLVSGPPLLVAVALEAVRQWRYQPTLLNGEPVEVITEIDVNFTLSQ